MKCKICEASGKYDFLLKECQSMSICLECMQGLVGVKHLCKYSEGRALCLGIAVREEEKNNNGDKED